MELRIKCWKRVGFSRLLGFVMVALLLVLGTGRAGAQNYNELFRQKKTQEKYLIKQLAYLKLYAGYLKQGYDVVSGGLNTISGITSGELGLHEAFFSSLSLVSPVVKRDYRALEIVSMQMRIARLFSLMMGSDVGAENLAYVGSVRENVLGQCNKDLDELLLVVSASSLELSDQERLSRLAKVHASMNEKLGFVMELFVQVQQLGEAQRLEKEASKKLGRLYE